MKSRESERSEFERFRDLARRLFSVSKKEVEAEQAKRRLERQKRKQESTGDG
jgi:hypothetical protein